MRSFDLTRAKLAFCQGEFDCWLKTPGVCRAKDLEQEIVAAVHGADALVFLGPVTFGGHGHALKLAIDRLICLLSPLFEKSHHLTHHQARYAKLPSCFAVGWLPTASERATATWIELLDGNAVNLLAPRSGACVLEGGSTAIWANDLRAMFAAPREPGAQIRAREPLRRALFEAAAADPALEHAPNPPRHVALLVGSPKVKGTSASEIMARDLGARFEKAGVTTELHFATSFVHDDARSSEHAKALASADLFLLVTPLYVDALPALTTHALELVARVRRSEPSRASFAMLVNCGFPEPEQNRTVLRIARHFADEAGYAWAGGLSLGGGGMISKERWQAGGGPLAHAITALDRAVPALVRGVGIPTAAIEAMAQAPMPDAVSRLFANLHWRWELHERGLPQRALAARPLDTR